MKAVKPESNTISWCASLPASDNRPMSDNDIIAIRSEIKRYPRRIALALLLIPILVLINIITFYFESAPNQSDLTFSSPLFLVFIVFILPVEIRYIGECLVHSRGLKADLKNGAILRFEGYLKSYNPLNETQSFLLKKSYLHPDFEAFQEIELLPTTLKIYRVNGQYVRQWKIAVIGQTAVTPEIADIAAQWLEPVGEVGDEEIYAGKRQLSISELNELYAQQKQIWKKSIPTIVCLFFLSLVGRDFDLSFTTSVRIRTAVLTIIVLGSFCELVSNVIRASKFYKDRKLESVIIIRHKITIDENVSGSIVEDQYKLFEFLPISRLLWTEEGHPASWRKLKL